MPDAGPPLEQAFPILAREAGGTYRIEPPSWMREPASRAVIDSMARADIAIRFVGGAVRDTLLGLPIVDIDMATPATPQRVIAALRRSGITAVPTGIAHGTVTAVTPTRHLEITTLRRDVETDGRHALVAFDADWAEDAARRDFTINALYLDPEGRLHDPVGGLADLARRRIRFVGEPARRIAEDVLRLLRYYRFEARFGREPEGDPAARAACRAAASRLTGLSAERVSQELLKLLAIPQPMRALQLMQEDGVLPVILPEALRPDRLDGLLAGEAARPPDPLLRLGALLTVDAAGAEALARRLRLSNARRDRLVGMAEPWPLALSADPTARRRALYRLGRERFADLVRLEAASGLMAAAERVALLHLAESWVLPKFPLAGRDVTALGVPAGPAVGELLGRMRAWWEEGDFAADRAACLARLRSLVSG